MSAQTLINRRAFSKAVGLSSRANSPTNMTACDTEMLASLFPSMLIFL